MIQSEMTLNYQGTMLGWSVRPWHTNEVVLNSNPHARVVSTTTVHPIVVGGLDLVVWVPTKFFGGSTLVLS